MSKDISLLLILTFLQNATNPQQVYILANTKYLVVIKKMNNHQKLEKARKELVNYCAILQNYNGNISPKKVINELDKIYKILGD